MGAGNSQTATTGPSFNVTSSAPWGPQQGYLTGAFQDAQNNYNQQSSTPYTGQFNAGPTANQYNAYGNAYGNAIGEQGNVNNQLNTGANESAAGFGDTQGTVNNLGGFTNANNAQNLGNQASQIASGFNVPAEVQAATNMAQLQADQSTIPNLYRNAAAGGDINSSQTALAQGVVQQGLDMNAQNLAATLENQNYGTGLTTGQNINAQNLSAMQEQGLLGLGLNSGGTNNTNSGFSNQTALNQQETGGANGVQNLNQLTDTSNLQNYLGPQSLQNQQLAALYGIIGSGNWGSQGTSLSSGSTTTTQQNPSLLSTIGAGTGVLGSLLPTNTNPGVIGSLGSFLV